MFSFFNKMRLPTALSGSSNNQDDSPADESRSGGLPWPATAPGNIRRPSGTTAAVGGGPSMISLGLSLSGGAHGHGHASTSQHPTISNPILRATPTSLTGYDANDTSSIRSGRRGGGGSISEARGTPQDAAQWYEQEIQKPKGRRLYPPPSPQSPAHAHQASGEEVGNEAERMAYAPPDVIRLDSGAFAAAAEDDDDEYDDQRFAYTANPRESGYAVPYPYGSPDPGYTPNSPPSMYSLSSQRDSRAMPFLASHFPQPPQHTGFDPNIQGQSDADFYQSPFDENEEENQGDVDDGLAPMAVPIPARSSTSTTSSRSMVSASSQPFGPGGSTPSLGGNGGAPATMTKAKWNLKLQLQHLQSPATRSTSSLPPGQTAPNRAGPSGSPQVSPQVSPPANEYPMNLNPTGVSVDTDVYKNAYNYPLAKQLSPIAEQDYFSPSPHSSRDKDADAGSMSFRFGGSRKASPGVESVLKLKPSGGFPPIVMADSDDRASIRSKTGSVRSSAGSVRAHGISRAPSGSDGPVSAGILRVPLGTPGGSDMPKPSPFISRPLNRTVSQTSSKSESVFQATPSHSQPTTPRLEGYIPAHVQAMQNRMIAQLSTSSISPRTTIGSTSGSGSGSATIRGSINTPDREILPTPPNSAGPTPVTATSASMFSPSTGAFQTPVSPTPRSPNNGSTPTISIQPPPGAMVASTPPTHTVHGAPADGITASGAAAALHKIPSIPAVTPIDLRFSMFGSQPQAKGSKTSMRRVDKMPVIEASVEGYYDDDEEEGGSEERDEEEGEFDEEYDEEEGEYEYERESLHADSFVTAGASHNGERGQRSNVELAPLPGRESLKDKTSAASMPRSTGDSVRTEARTINQRASGGGRSVGESFIHRRWDRDEGYGNGGPLSSSPETTTFKAKKEPNWAIKMSSFTPALWAFWLGFLFPVLWLVGGWHFTNAGEMPPKYTVWEWYFWNRRWRARSWFKGKMRNLLGCWKRTTGRKREARKSVDSTLSFRDNLPQQRRQGRRRSSKSRAGKVYPALPRWVAEKQSTDDGRMRLNDPKRSLRGIQFGYPFISRPPTSQASYGSGRIAGSRPMFLRILTSPNRLLDQLYGVKLKEVRGRPESGRRMFDPWVQRSRYAFCYGLLLLAAGLCTACVYLISINTKNLHKN